MVLEKEGSVNKGNAETVRAKIGCNSGGHCINGWCVMKSERRLVGWEGFMDIF